MEAFIGSVIIFGGNFAPSQWALCQGQLLAISSNQALFAILGTTFGGNGVQTFGLPNLASRIAVGTGQGPGLSNYVLGELGGTENTSVLISNLPPHTHTAVATVNATSTVNALSAVPTASLLPSPVGHYWANSALSGATPTVVNAYAASGGTAVTMASNAVTTAVTGTVTNALTGSGIPLNNLQPFLAVNYIISLFGIFPSRN